MSAAKSWRQFTDERFENFAPVDLKGARRTTFPPSGLLVPKRSLPCAKGFGTGFSRLRRGQRNFGTCFRNIFPEQADDRIDLACAPIAAEGCAFVVLALANAGVSVLRGLSVTAAAGAMAGGSATNGGSITRGASATAGILSCETTCGVCAAKRCVDGVY